MTGGFIKLYRSMTKWEWYGDVNTKAVFLHLLLMAAHESAKWQGIEIKRGQVVIGRKKLADVLGLSEQQIRTCLDRLKSTNEITTESTNKYTLVTIVNYDKFQSYEKNATNKITNGAPTDNQQITTYKNDKNDNDMIRYDLLSSKGKRAVSLYTDHFGKTGIGYLYDFIGYYGERVVYDAVNKTIGKQVSDPIRYINQVCAQKSKYTKDYFLVEGRGCEI